MSAAPSVFRHRAASAPDGVLLDAFEAGVRGAPAVVLVNAFRMPVSFFEPIGAALAQHCHVVTWEARGILNTEQAFDEARCDIAAQCGDMRAVMDECGVARANFVAWCSGALVSLRFAALEPQRVEKSVLLSGSFPVASVPSSVFAAKATALYEQCSESRRRTQSIWKVVFAGRGSGADPRNSLSTAWGRLPAELWDMINGPYRSAEALYRYSNTVLRARAERMDTWLGSVRAPVLMLGGARDGVVNPESWSVVCRGLPGAQLLLKEHGDHLLLHNDATVSEIVREFFEGASFHDANAHGSAERGRASSLADGGGS